MIDVNDFVRVTGTNVVQRVHDAVKMVMDGKIKANSSAHAILKVWMMHRGSL